MTTTPDKRPRCIVCRLRIDGFHDVGLCWRELLTIESTE